MSEPVYSFVKGKGWIASVDRSITRELTRHGKRYRVTIYDRRPEPGELYTNRAKFYKTRPHHFPANLTWNFTRAAFGTTGAFPSDKACVVVTELIDE